MRTPLILGLTMILLTTGCTSTRSMEGDRIERLKVGEDVTVYENSGRVSKLTLANITPDEIAGQYLGNGQTITMPREEIREIEVERIDYVKSAAAGVGGVAAVAAAVIVGFVMLIGAAGA